MTASFQGPEARRLLAEIQAHPGWPLVMEWLDTTALRAAEPIPVEGADWPLKRAFQDGEASGLAKLKSMLAIATKYPGKIDARGRLVPSPSEMLEEGEDEITP